MKILLIAGHGAGDPGAVSTIDKAPYKEAEETRTMVALVAAKLAGYDIDVQVYDTARNAYSDYKAGRLVIPADCDYVLELHFNAFQLVGADGKTKGVECYVTTKEKATGVEESICEAIAALGFTNRGVKRYDWAVISKAKAVGVSSALLELCFIDDADDMRLYLKSREKIASAIAQAVAEGFDLEKVTAKPAATGTIYRVQVGAFSSLENAERLKKELEAKGYKPFISKA